MTTTAELRFATRIVLERHRVPFPQPVGPLARRIRALEPEPVRDDRAEWLRRGRFHRDLDGGHAA